LNKVLQIFIDILEAAKLNSKDNASKDFHQPEASPAGEVADMELAIVSGRGLTLVASNLLSETKTLFYLAAVTKNNLWKSERT